MNIRIDRPSLNRGSAEANIAILDRWIADTADKLNNFATQINISNADMREKISDLEREIVVLQIDIANQEQRIKDLEEGAES